MVSAHLSKKKYFHIIPDLAYYLLFGIICFFVIYKVYDPEILYFKLQPFFSFDPSFLDYHFHEQLGYISLISQYVMQFFYYPVAGGLIISFILLLFALQYRIIFNHVIKDLGRGFELLPPLIILISLKSYSVTLDALIMFFIIGLFVIGKRLFQTDILILKIIFQIICIYLFFNILGIIPAFALLVFFVVDELILSKTSGRFVIILTDIIIFTLLTFSYLGFTMAVRSFQTTFPAKLYISVPSYWYLFAVHILVILLSPFGNMSSFKTFVEKIPSYVPTKWIILLALIVLGFIYSDKLFINRSKYNDQIEFYASGKNWDKVLSLKYKPKKEDRISRFLLNRALYEKGQMANDLFSIPQDGGEYTLLLTKTFTHECTMYSSDLFYDMGFIKGANYWATEAQTFEPYSPRILQRIALTSLLLEEYPISIKYLNILESSFIYKKWASGFLEMANKKNISPLIKSLNKENIYKTEMLYIDNENPNHILLEILRESNHNKMAFEYLESYYLLRNDLGNFYTRLSNMVNMGYREMPKTFQEAAMIYYIRNDVPEGNPEYQLNIDTQKRFDSFNKILYEYKTNPEMAKEALHESFGNTYWYYLRYDSPRTTGISLKKRKL